MIISLAGGTSAGAGITQRLVYSQMKIKTGYSRYGILLTGLCIVLFLLFLYSFTAGRYTGVNAIQAFKILFNQLFGNVLPQDWTNTAETVVVKHRLPRVLAAILVGAALPMAGASYQAIFANPMASPDTLGVSNGAAVGAVIAILLGFSSFMVEVSAFVMGCLAVIIVYLLSVSLSKGRNMILYLVLVGMVISALLSAVLSLLKYVCDQENQLPAITYWLMGSFNSVTWQDTRLYAVFFLIGTAPLMLLRWRMNLLMLSDTEAKALGESILFIRSITIVSATLLTAASIAITGGIGWVGLVIPHVARIIVGQDFRKVLPACALMGSIFLLIMDNISRTALATEIPIGILTSVIGAPVFFYVLIRYRGSVLHDG